MLTDKQTVILIEAGVAAFARSDQQVLLERLSPGEPLHACATALSTEDEQYALLLRGPKISADTIAAARECLPGPDLARQIVMETVPGYGWWQRAVTEPVQGMLMILFGMRFQDTTMRDEFVRLTHSHAEYCWGAEPETLVYGLGNVIGGTHQFENVMGSPPIAEGDLMVAMVCTSQAALDKHANDPRHLSLGARVAGAGIAVENPFARTYQLTGDGHLGR